MTNKNINQVINNYLQKNEELKSLYNNLKEYRNLKEKHDFKFMCDVITEYILNGCDKNICSILSGSDESNFNLYDRLSYLADSTEEEETNDLINYIKLYKDDDLFKITENNYIENNYLYEDLVYIFNLKNLYENDIFTYCSSYLGNLYLNKTCIDKLPQDTQEEILNDIDVLNDYLLDLDIRKLFANFCFDFYLDSFIIEMPQENINHEEERLYKNCKEELTKRLNNLQNQIIELKKEIKKCNSDIIKELVQDEIIKILYKIKEIKEVLN